MTTRKFDPVRDVRDFHQAFEQRVASYPEFPEQDERALRVKLLREEFGEYIAAEEGDDFIEVADALADMLYIICGTAVSYGIPLEDLHNEVHRSNMDKLVNGKPIKREVPHLPDVTRSVASAQAPPPSQGSKAKAKRAYTQSAAHDQTEG